MKGTHVFVPLAERLKRQGLDVELMFFHDVPSTKIRYYQAQADIVLDQLTIGWFGANGRESLMLGKPVVCWLRPSWLEQVGRQLPDYVDELPVVERDRGDRRGRRQGARARRRTAAASSASEAARSRSSGTRPRPAHGAWTALYRRLLDGEPIPDAPVEPPRFAVETSPVARLTC